MVCAPVSVVRRCIATGDNNEVYIPTDAGYKEFQYDDDVVYWPPSRTIMVEEPCDTVEETRWDQTLAQYYRVKFGQSMPTIHRDKAPERDLVNYPPHKVNIYPEAVRLLILPDNWFRELYSRTGVTGPYCLTFGVLAFLFSKEWLIYDHEMHFGWHLAIVVWFFVHKFGPITNRYIEGIVDVSTR